MELPAVVRTDCCPVITEYHHLPTALAHDGLDGEGHAWRHGSRVGVPAGEDVGRAVEVGSDAVTREGGDHGETLAGDEVLNSVTDTGELLSWSTLLYPDPESLPGHLHQPLTGLVHLPHQEGVATVPVDAV